MYITLRNGKQFHYDKPDTWSEAIDINTIAHALSQINRWGGHTSEPWSVLQHSLVMAMLCEELPDAWAALIHDVTEAITGDFTRPLLHYIPALRDFKLEIETKIFVLFKFTGMTVWTKYLDDQIIHAEASVFGLVPHPDCQDDLDDMILHERIKNNIFLLKGLKPIQIVTQWRGFYKLCQHSIPALHDLPDNLKVQTQ